MATYQFYLAVIPQKGVADYCGALARSPPRISFCHFPNPFYICPQSRWANI